MEDNSDVNTIEGNIGVEKQAKINSGSNIVDDFLNGGYDKDIISTIYGPASSGKTTFCLLAGINIVKPITTKLA